MSASKFEFNLSNHRADFPSLLQAADDWARSVLLPQPAKNGLAIVLNEIVGNIISYGRWPKETVSYDISVKVTWVGDSLSIQIRDASKAFDPLSVAPPELDSSLEDRTIGGLGIHIVRQIMDHFEYRRESGENVLTMTLYTSHSGT